MGRDGEPDGDARENGVKRHREGELEMREQDGIGVHRSFRQAQGENRTVGAGCARHAAAKVKGGRCIGFVTHSRSPVDKSPMSEGCSWVGGRFAAMVAGLRAGSCRRPCFAGRLAERSIGWGS